MPRQSLALRAFLSRWQKRLDPSASRSQSWSREVFGRTSPVLPPSFAKAVRNMNPQLELPSGFSVTTTESSREILPRLLLFFCTSHRSRSLRCACCLEATATTLPKRVPSTNLSLTGSGKTSPSRLTILLERCACSSLSWVLGSNGAENRFKRCENSKIGQKHCLSCPRREHGASDEQGEAR